MVSSQRPSETLSTGPIVAYRRPVIGPPKQQYLGIFLFSFEASESALFVLEECN